MPPLNPLSRSELIQKLRALGFTGPYSGTRHQYMEKETQRVFIPNPHGKDIGVPLLKQIMKQINIDRDTFIAL